MIDMNSVEAKARLVASPLGWTVTQSEDANLAARRPQMKKMWTKKTEQYEDEMPPDPQPLLEFRGGYPACAKHGACLCYKNDVWRCIECGWAVIIRMR